MPYNPSDRRRFFRIIDMLGVAYRILPEGEPEDSDEGEKETAEFVDAFSIISEYNEAINSALEDLQSRDPQAAEAIDQLNKKVEALMTILELENLMTQRVPHRVEETSISASGIAFAVDEQLAPETDLALGLILKPSSKHISAIGKVISCDPLPETNRFYLRVDFLEMSSQHRDRLIQHLIQRQGDLLRELKSNMNDL